MDKLSAKQENIINCLLGGDNWIQAKERNNLSWRQINQLRESELFRQELKLRQQVLLRETTNHSHIYINDALKALHKLTMTSKNEKIILESAKTLLNAVNENIDMIITLETRNEIDDIKKQLCLDYE